MTASHDQIEMLLQFMQEHPSLAKGLISNADGRARCKLLWNELCDRLNSLGGAVKTVKQWQKVWADRKYLAKKAAAANRRAQFGTGGGPSTQPPLSDMEQKVVAIMGDGFGLPQTTAVIPAFENHIEVQEDEEINQTPPPPPPPSTSRAPTRQRVRIRRQAEDIRSQLIRLEEKKIAELAGLRHEIRQLVGAVKECCTLFNMKNNQNEGT